MSGLSLATFNKMLSSTSTLKCVLYYPSKECPAFGLEPDSDGNIFLNIYLFFQCVTTEITPSSL